MRRHGKQLNNGLLNIVLVIRVNQIASQGFYRAKYVAQLLLLLKIGLHIKPWRIYTRPAMRKIRLCSATGLCVHACNNSQ